MTESWRSRAVDGIPDGTILFDGVCVLCSGWVRFVIKRDPAARFKFLAIQTAVGRMLAHSLGVDADDPQTNIVVRNGVAYFKSDAAIVVLRALPGWRWIAGFRLMPRGLRNFAYDLVARNRYRLFGRRTSCLLPGRETTRHFLAGEPAQGTALLSGETSHATTDQSRG